MSKKNPNSFFSSLEENIRASSHAALVKSVVADPDQTIGQILASLGEQEEAKYLLDAFKEMSIGEIVQGAVELQLAMARLEDEGQPAPAPVATPIASTPKRNGTTKKAAPPRPVKTNGVSKDKPEAMDLSNPDKVKAYENSIIKALKSGKHVDEESGISNSHLRKVVGGTTDQARGVLDALIDSGRVSFYGKARGMKYYIFA